MSWHLRVLYIAGSCVATLTTVFNQPLKLRLSLVSLSAGFNTDSFNVTQASGRPAKKEQSRAGCDLSDRGRLFLKQRHNGMDCAKWALNVSPSCSTPFNLVLV